MVWRANNTTEFLELLKPDPLWHTTSEARFRGVLDAAVLSPEPAIPDAERWGTACGPDGYPFARRIGAVSLFDFEGFEPDAYTLQYPSSDWHEFVPCRRGWPSAIWIAIDENAPGITVIRRMELLQRWKEAKEFSRNILPALEAAAVGDVPVEAFRRVLIVRAVPALEKHQPGSSSPPWRHPWLGPRLHFVVEPYLV